MATGIRERILVAFVVLLIVPMTILGTLSYYGIQKVGTTATSGSVSALELQEKNNLMNISDDQAHSADFFLDGIRDDTVRLQQYASNLFSDRSEFGNGVYPSVSYTGRPLSPALPAYGYINLSNGEGKGAWADWDHRLVSSPYLNSTVVRQAEADASYAAWVRRELNTTAQLDMILKPVYEKNQPSVVATWFVRSGGISTSYQVPPLDWGELLAPGGGKNATWNESYEEYYQVATPGRNPGKGAVWVPPYYDTVGNGWLISSVAPVYKGDEFVGVIGIDLTLDAVSRAVLGVKVLRSGHAFLIGKNGDAIAHRDLEDAIARKDAAGDELVVHITELETDNSDFATAVSRMNSGERAIIKVMYRDGRQRYLAFAPVPSAGFAIGVVIPVEEVTRSIKDVETHMNDANARTIQLMIVIDAVAAVVVIGAAVVLANRIVKPIKELTEAARSVSEGNLNVNLTSKFKDELQTLARSFQNVLVTLRLGNIAYYEGDSTKALENYGSALQLFEATENLKGMSMSYNNLGNIYRGWRENNRALEYYQKALAIDEKMKNQKGIASRLGNIGIVYKNLGRLDKALEKYTAALEIARASGDRMGIASMLNNIGIVYQAQGNQAKAMELFREALALDEETGNIRGMSSRLNNMAVIHTHQGNFREALEASLRSLKISQDLEDQRGLANDYVNLHKIYEAMGEAEKSKAFLAKYREVRSKVETSRKTVIFVLDRSESMYGTKLDAAKEGAINLFRNKVYEDDNVGIIAFSSDSKVVMKLSKKKGSEKLFETTVGALRPEGMTSFYDAVGDALDHFRIMGKDSSLWIVALTDGEDNTSYRFAIGSMPGRSDISTYVEEIGINATIIIIGVGDSVDRNAMKTIAGPKGKYIPVTEQGDVDIGTAIKEAYKEVEMLFEDEEKVEGFVPEA